MVVDHQLNVQIQMRRYVFQKASCLFQFAGEVFLLIRQLLVTAPFFY